MGKPADEAWAWLKSQLGDKAALLLALFFFIAVGVNYLRSMVAEAAEERVRPVRIHVDRLDAAQGRFEQDVHEFARDLRELYRVSPITRRSERLEAPFPTHDGGY